MKALECMNNHYDGSRWGLSDWYPEIEEGIREAIESGPESGWTTNWYSSKKECASACITHLKGTEIIVEASVSDDFDTNGYGEVTIDVDFDDADAVLESIRDALDTAWDIGEKDREANKSYEGYKVIHNNRWVETYLLNISDMTEPPGDYYYEWGWQGEGEIPEGVKDVLEKFVNSFSDGECTCDGYTIKRWDD